MTVYVDDCRLLQGRLKSWQNRLLISHMIADTSEELGDMAEAVGLREAWIRYPNTAAERFDVSQTKRTEAIRRGAVPINSRELVEKIDAKRSENHDQ